MIHVDDLRFTYPGSDAPTLHGLGFEVHEGEIFGFLGPSGAGKSTTQNILIGLLRGWQGSIQVLDKALASWGRDYYGHIGVSFELPNHYLKLTARENLEYFRALYQHDTASSEEVMALVGLAGELDKPVAAFSKGMKNRLTLARSLLSRPTLWFLDEPTAGLDPVNAVKVRELVKARRAQGVTTLITTHDMLVADDLCDRVAFIVDGTLVECDAPESLKRRYGKREIVVQYGPEDSPNNARFPLDGVGEQTEFLRILREEPLLSVHSQETTLEDVFVQVTGRSLR
ncbi:ATP-binding cassette domain-containing protein [Haliangium sp.]|uniref:ABC transporter ATP-binding protein n=1 Tax=Haliangium sp. TaxID=2663208 RepID=UPI003D0FD96F